MAVSEVPELFGKLRDNFHIDFKSELVVPGYDPTTNHTYVLIIMVSIVVFPTLSFGPMV